MKIPPMKNPNQPKNISFQNQWFFDSSPPHTAPKLIKMPLDGTTIAAIRLNRSDRYSAYIELGGTVIENVPSSRSNRPVCVSL
jgi:hypothetical protein